MPIKPGESQFVDILAGKVAVGAKGTLVLKNGSGAAQPGQKLTLQNLAEGTSTTAATTTSGTTAGCEAKLVVTKELLGGSDVRTRPGNGGLFETTFPRAPLHYAIRVVNVSDCIAKNVSIDDTLPRQCDCFGGKAGDVSGLNPDYNDVACTGIGRHVAVDVGDIPPRGTAVLAIDGTFAGPGRNSSYTASNTGYARAENASEEASKPVVVNVVLHSEFNPH